MNEDDIEVKLERAPIILLDLQESILIDDKGKIYNLCPEPEYIQ